MKHTENNSDTISEKTKKSASRITPIYDPKKVHDIWQHYSDEKLQDYLLQGVSRTFALTIPELPGPLQDVIGNAYLLCRIVDTIEDSKLPRNKKERFCQQFAEVVEGNAGAAAFTKELSGLLGADTKQAEHELIWLTERVIAITHSFEAFQQKAIVRCVDIMAEGMAYFQENASTDGLENVQETNKYCYCVAGVVGEMLTDLFCCYSDKIARNKDQLMDLSVRFGLALQMTNILKDMWTDYERAVCWLPRSVFNEHGFDLQNLPGGRSTQPFRDGLEHLIGLTNAHLHKAMEYALLIPAEEKGIRRFCLWCLGMSALTLRKINHNKSFTDGNQVKISRNSVKGTILVINMTVKRNALLKGFFKLATLGLPYRADKQ